MKDCSYNISQIDKIINIVPSFVSYKVVPNTDNGFKFIGIFNSLDELLKEKIFIESKYIFSDKDTFFNLKNKKIGKNLYCEYPIVKDNPCGIIYRLAFPFLINLTGNSLVLEKINDKIFCFNINL